MRESHYTQLIQVQQGLNVILLFNSDNQLMITKLEAVDLALKQVPFEIKEQNLYDVKEPGFETVKHLIRSILIIIDNTKTMKIKDFKPSRIALTVKYLKMFITKIMDINPITFIAIAVAEEDICRQLTQFTSNSAELFDFLDNIKVNEKGSFSLCSCLSTAISIFGQVPLFSSKEILLIQSSPSTKDVGDVFKYIQTVSDAKITVNIISLVGITYIFRILTQKCNGRYQTVHDEQSYYNTVTSLPIINNFDKDRVKIQLFKVGFCKREIKEDYVYCFCHLREELEVYICSICEAILCRVPTTCCICKAQIILPGDLYRHYESK